MTTTINNSVNETLKELQPAILQTIEKRLQKNKHN